jgi:hypothetical protein
MAYERIDRGMRTPEEAEGYKEVMAEALPKLSNWSNYAQQVGSLSLDMEVKVEEVWKIPETGRHIFGISEAERQPPADPYIDTYIDPKVFV